MKIPGLTTGLKSESLFGLSALGVALIVASAWLYLWRQAREKVLVDDEKTLDEVHFENRRNCHSSSGR